MKMVLLGTLAISLLGLVTQLLWNWLVPILFGGIAITFWQSLGLLLLSKILLWPFGKRHHRGYQGGYWKPNWKEKWGKMTEEEKLQFRERMKEKCNWGRSSEPNSPQA